MLERLQRLWRRHSRNANALLAASKPQPRSGVAGAPRDPAFPGSDASVKKGAVLSISGGSSSNSNGHSASTGSASSSPAAASPTDRKEERLPDVMWKPAQEFPGSTTIDRRRMSFSRESQILGRIAGFALHSILKPSRLMLLGTCSVGVVGITSYEAQLLLDPACSLVDAIEFTYKYSVENFMASCIWETRSPELCAQALGLDTEQLLRKLDPANSPADAQRSLQLHGAYTMRSIVAGFMVITQLLSIVRESMLATKRYTDNVFDGREPPLRGVRERIIRLAGDGSDVTEVSMDRYGAHILPVYESLGKWRHLVGLWSLNGRVPCVWQVASGHYGYRHSWARLEIDESFMLRTTTGKYILCIEADATNLDRAHELQKPNNDVTLEEAAQAYRMIERAASRKLQRPFRSLTVFLGDSLQLCDTGGTSFVTLRERIRLKKEVDVLIDAKAPLLLAILKWCGRFADKHKTVVLDATPLNYAPLQLLLERNGYKVLSPAEADEWKPPPAPEAPASPVSSASQSTNSQKASGTSSSPSQPLSGSAASKTSASSAGAASSTKDANKETTKAVPAGAKPPTATLSAKKEKLPRLIYYPTTAATINAVHSVLTAGLAEPRLCCVLINSPFGLSHLKEIAEYEEEDFHPICAAEIYDDYFRQVRIWTRMGHAPSVIQKELDLRFAPVLDVQKEIAQLQRATTTMKKL
ncbi:hypothetical protein ATCC90586_004572 [Pythium insidiosum]|nr:hypothetical protein ATCC90586_004572 [Pythium insidiosum]